MFSTVTPAGEEPHNVAAYSSSYRKEKQSPNSVHLFGGHRTKPINTNPCNQTRYYYQLCPVSDTIISKYEQSSVFLPRLWSSQGGIYYPMRRQPRDRIYPIKHCQFLFSFSVSCPVCCRVSAGELFPFLSAQPEVTLWLYRRRLEHISRGRLQPKLGLGFVITERQAGGHNIQDSGRENIRIDCIGQRPPYKDLSN